MLQYHHEEQLDFLLKVLFCGFFFTSYYQYSAEQEIQTSILLVSVSGFIHFVTDRGIFIKRDIFINLMET